MYTTALPVLLVQGANLMEGSRWPRQGTYSYQHQVLFFGSFAVAKGYWLHTHAWLVWGAQRVGFNILPLVSHPITHRVRGGLCCCFVDEGRQPVGCIPHVYVTRSDGVGCVSQL
jgi:hypothetical protein